MSISSKFEENPPTFLIELLSFLGESYGLFEGEIGTLKLNDAFYFSESINSVLSSPSINSYISLKNMLFLNYGSFFPANII